MTAAAVIPAAYTVQRGQSLWSIAVDKLGDGARYREILNLNPRTARRPEPDRARAGIAAADHLELIAPPPQALRRGANWHLSNGLLFPVDGGRA